ncbi:MAG: nickel-dependent hydrogenase large subunit [Coriobacteriia bacterium]|nr:nickel-dependent hydrogenase large subunit [Coriobacteriia bacterium]
MVKSVIDPVTRIEGHLRVECEVENGVITDAWVSGTLFRGMETIMQGRDPSDAYFISQRICGVCPISHGHASSMSAESALGVDFPGGARLVRNLIEAAEFLHSHILWFYTLAALDYVNPAKALEADIAATYDLAQAAGTSTANFAAVQSRIKTLVEGGDLSIFTNGYLDHPGYPEDMPAELHLIAVAHYLEALEVQAEAAQIIALMGGKFPHFMTSIPGGTAWVPTVEKLDDVLFRFKRVHDWIYSTMIPDTLAIAPFYKDALTYGGGHGNFLAWGVFDSASRELPDRYLPSGAVFTSKGLSVEEADEGKILEYVDHTWLNGDGKALHPSEGKTVPPQAFTGYDPKTEYSWAKAPRYDGAAMEVGPLARMVVAYLKGVAPVKTLIDTALEALGAAGKPEVLVSLLGRIAARNLEAAVIADWSLEWVTELIETIKSGEKLEFHKPLKEKNGKGAGLWEAPRGALGHWMNVSGGKIANYQVCTPSTWDLSPRDADGIRGPMEEALIGVPVIDPERPIEAGRIARSFDP